MCQSWVKTKWHFLRHRMYLEKYILSLWAFRIDDFVIIVFFLWYHVMLLAIVKYVVVHFWYFVLQFILLFIVWWLLCYYCWSWPFLIMSICSIQCFCHFPVFIWPDGSSLLSMCVESATLSIVSRTVFIEIIHSYVLLTYTYIHT